MVFVAPNNAELETNEDDFLSASPPDDDTRWRGSTSQYDVHTDARRVDLLSKCEQKLQLALQSETPRRLISAITSRGCTALHKAECARCRICPSDHAWANVLGYYKGQKAKIFICADKEPSQKNVEQTLTHELVHAYDHCRFGMNIPIVGRHQAPWALTCAATACSEVCYSLLHVGAVFDVGVTLILILCYPVVRIIAGTCLPTEQLQRIWRDHVRQCLGEFRVSRRIWWIWTRE